MKIEKEESYTIQLTEREARTLLGTLQFASNAATEKEIMLPTFIETFYNEMRSLGVLPYL